VHVGGLGVSALQGNTPGVLEMTDERRADIYTVRPPGETLSYSCAMIEAELKTAGLEGEKIVEGITQLDGSKMFWVYLVQRFGLNGEE